MSIVKRYLDSRTYLLEYIDSNKGFASHPTTYRKM